MRLRLVRDDLGKLERSLPVIKRAVHRVIARTFWEITRSNFGISGAYRPHPWAPLTPKYIQRLRRKSFGTPLVPTLLRAGTLINSIRLGADERAGKVWTDNPYAAAHQFGVPSKKLPARPYFPVIGGQDGSSAELTPKANLAIGIAARREMEKFIL